jgi:neutral ceramidase
MKARHLFCLFALMLACRLGAAAPATNAPALKAGYCEMDITPDIGMEQPGGYGKSFHRTLHDPCKARAVVFDDGQKRVALVGTDTLIIPRDLVLKARARIQALCGIEPEAIMIGASHSHSSGPVGMVQPGEFDHASDLVKKLAYEQSSCADPKFLKYVEDQIVAAVELANNRRAISATGFGSGIEDQVAFNRRLRMKNGLSFSHPGAGNPDIIGYAGPIDPQVGVIGTWSKDGQLIGCVVNYTCHATTNPGGISANWIQYLEHTIRGTFGENVVVVYLQGACGDITQVDNLSPYARPAAEQWSRLVGGRVGAEAVKVLLSMTPGTNAPVDFKSKVWNIPRRKPSPAHLQQSLAIVQGDPKKFSTTEVTFAKEILMLDALIQKHPSVEVEVQAIQVGPVVCVSNPAEYFVNYGLDIKKRSQFPLTFIVELANGCVGYVPTLEAFGPNGGGYETRLTAYSNLEISAGQQFADTGVALANSLTPVKIPTPPPAPPFRSPWAYGNVPPEVK